MAGHRLSARIRQLGTSPLAFRRRLRLAPALLFAAACSGCAAFSPDGGMAVVNGIVAPELKSEVVKVNGEDVAARPTPVPRTCSRPRFRGRRRRPHHASEQQGWLASHNGRHCRSRDGGSEPAAQPDIFAQPHLTPVELDIERRIIADILALATLPARAARRRAFPSGAVACRMETLRVGFETCRAYYRAVAAQELAASLAQAAGPPPINRSPRSWARPAP